MNEIDRKKYDAWKLDYPEHYDDDIEEKEVNLNSIEVDGIDLSDYPDFSDAYATYAEYIDGTELDESELEELDVSGVTYQTIIDRQLYL